MAVRVWKEFAQEAIGLFQEARQGFRRPTHAGGCLAELEAWPFVSMCEKEGGPLVC